jgi:hypothetical protein
MPAGVAGAGMPIIVTPVVFVGVIFVLGFCMSLGKATVYKQIPAYYPNHVGAVGGVVGMMGGLGGFILPIAFGFPKDVTGLWSICFKLLFTIVAVSLIWMNTSIRQFKRHADVAMSAGTFARWAVPTRGRRSRITITAPADRMAVCQSSDPFVSLRDCQTLLTARHRGAVLFLTHRPGSKCDSRSRLSAPVPMGASACGAQRVARNSMMARRSSALLKRWVMRVPRTIAPGLVRKVSSVSELQVIPEARRGEE